jgi:hypothetical protein
MQYEERFSDSQLGKIIEEGMIYMCACPAQVAEAMRKLRELHRYQQQCLTQPTNDAMVHKAIAESTVQAHALLQDCLDHVLTLEKWDRATLQMPDNLRVRQMTEMLAED